VTAPWRCGAALLLLLGSGQNGWAAERTLLLEIVLNGRPTGTVGEILEIDGALFATPAEMRELGFVLPDALAGSAVPVPFSGLRGVRAEVNMADQRLLVTAEDMALQPTELGVASRVKLAPVTPSGTGAVLNYDVLGTHSGRANSGGALLDARMFSPYGVLSASAVGTIGAGSGLRRLDTTYIYSDPGELRRWRVGDVVSGALGWTRAVRLGGAQIASNFALRPDLITYPLPVITSSAAVPSTVDVLVNGIRQYSQPVQPGPFQVRSLPVVTGAGEVGVTVQDALGRQVVVTLPFYAAPELLVPGLASYSAEVGAVRQGYGLGSDGYGSWAASGSVRYGLTDWITPELHAEGSRGLQAGGAGAAVRIGTLGVLQIAASGSVATDPAGGKGSGTQGFVGVSRRSGGLSVAVSGTAASAGFRDIAALNGASNPRLGVNASVAQSFGPYGSVGVGYVRQQGGHQLLSSASNGLLSSAGNVALVTASWSVQVTEKVGFYVTGFKDLRGHNMGASFGLTFFFGGAVSASAGSSIDRGRFGTSLQANRPAVEQGDVGFNLNDQEGGTASRRAQGEYLARWGRASAGVAQSGASVGGAASQAGMRGSVVLAGGDFYLGDQVNDSFAVVNSGDVPGVPVLFENRRIGTTDSRGRLLVPYLNAYQSNTLALDPDTLPPDVEIDRTNVQLRPESRSGVMVDFGVRRIQAALLKLRTGAGLPVPVGASVRQSNGVAVPVGHDGEAYVTGLGAANILVVDLPDATQCRVSFAYRSVSGDLPVIGPLACR
jgi:outer membrane usher protein